MEMENEVYSVIRTKERSECIDAKANLNAWTISTLTVESLIGRPSTPLISTFTRDVYKGYTHLSMSEG